MPSRFCIRVLRKDGSSRYSTFFESLEEADRWQAAGLHPGLTALASRP